MGEKEGTSLDSLSEQATTVTESEVLRYLGGAIVGGAAGDVIQDVFSGIIVQLIVDVFLMLGFRNAVLQSESSCPEGVSCLISVTRYVPSPLVRTAGTIIAVVLPTIFLWRYFRPLIYPRLQKDWHTITLRVALVSVTVGLIVGAFLGTFVAVIVSAVAAVALVPIEHK